MAADTLCCTGLGVVLSTEDTQIQEMHSTETLAGEVGSVENMQAKLKTEPGLSSNFTYKNYDICHIHNNTGRQLLTFTL
jgi:hypothetical protein